MSLELLFASHAAKIICFSIISNLEFGCLLIENHTANWISRHDLSLLSGFNEYIEVCFCLLLLVAGASTENGEAKNCGQRMNAGLRG